jgi:hypothetical protein
MRLNTIICAALMAPGARIGAKSPQRPAVAKSCLPTEVNT